MLSSRMNVRSCLVQPWRRATYSQARHPEAAASSLRVNRTHSTTGRPSTKSETTGISSASPEQRRRHLEQHGWTSYPRPGARSVSIASLLSSFENKLEPGEVASSTSKVEVTGRISSVRTSGSKLVFVDIYQSPSIKIPRKDDSTPTIQIIVNKSQIVIEDNLLSNSVKAFGKLVQKGDTIHAIGHLYRTSSGELSIRAERIPELLSPCLHQIPTGPFTNDSEHAQDRHVHMLANPAWTKIVFARSIIVTAIHDYMRRKDFLAVQTPILAASAGGATARPFETTATEFPGRKLALRIAPELWLKKLLIGGMSKVYEIGQSFRNEGIDKTHNPEFTTCEFYATNWDIEKLKRETEMMFGIIVGRLLDAHMDLAENVKEFTTLPEETLEEDFAPQWHSLDFITALNSALDLDLPDLSSPTARHDVLAIFQAKGLPIPPVPTLPRLLDKLCSVYLEPLCDKPTWIINTPECLSPLAKSFGHPDLPHQMVAARAELFINSKEVVNCYEEENSPVEQRRKFIDQQKHASIDEEVDLEAMKIDEDYLRALEWGLPPTGGWGCGLDRVLMLLLGKDKISDVLSFGNLRMVTHGAEKTEKVSGLGETHIKLDAVKDETGRIANVTNDPAMYKNAS